MIKVETLGMIDVAKNNPVLKSEKDVANYSFLTINGDLYLIANTLTGDDAYKEDVVIKAGEYLNGFLIKAWEGQKLIADEKHITYAEGKSYADITVGTSLTINDKGNLEIATAAPSGIFFQVTDKCKLTENAVKLKVIVND